MDTPKEGRPGWCTRGISRRAVAAFGGACPGLRGPHGGLHGAAVDDRDADEAGQDGVVVVVGRVLRGGHPGAAWKWRPAGGGDPPPDALTLPKHLQTLGISVLVAGFGGTGQILLGFVGSQFLGKKNNVCGRALFSHVRMVLLFMTRMFDRKLLSRSERTVVSGQPCMQKKCRQ